MKIIAQFLTAVIFAMTLLTGAHARTPVPIVNYDNEVWVRPDNKPLELDEIKNRIIKAGQEKSWTIVAGPSENALIGTLVVRDKHTVRVSIQFNASAFSVRYLDSVNMNFSARDRNAPSATGATGQDQPASPGVIHPFYNRWAQELVNSIRNQLQI